MGTYYITIRVYGPDGRPFLGSEEYLTSYATRETLSDAIEWADNQLAHYKSQGYCPSVNVYHNGGAVYTA